MKKDPFGNLADYRPVLELVHDLADKGKLAKCQPGLIRILRYKGNWRLREAVLKRVGEIQTPSENLVSQILSILADDNIYYDVRILAGHALIQLSESLRDGFCDGINTEAQKVTEKLRSTPRPPFFVATLEKLYFELHYHGTLEN